MKLSFARSPSPVSSSSGSRTAVGAGCCVPPVHARGPPALWLATSGWTSASVILIHKNAEVPGFVTNNFAFALFRHNAIGSRQLSTTGRVERWHQKRLSAPVGR